jgi:predicted nucleic acid-binding protein
VKVAFDTSILVPAVVAGHRHHARAQCWLRAVETGRLEGTASWHAMSETWSVLTRLSVRPRISSLTA